MFFLLRMGFWFSLVLLALPLDGGQDGASVGPLQALAAAKGAVSDIADLCTRKPDVCETGRLAAQTVAARAQTGGRLALALLDDETRLPDTEMATGGFPPLD